MPDRSTRWLWGDSFELVGGRPPKPRSYEGVPLRTFVPAWLSDIALQLLRERGIAAERIIRDIMSTEIPGYPCPLAIDAIEFSYDQDLTKLRKALQRLHRHAQGLC